MKLKVKVIGIIEFETDLADYPSDWTREQIIANIKDDETAYTRLIESDDMDVKVEITEQ